MSFSMKVIVKVILDDRKALKYRIKRNSSLQKLFEATSEASNIPLDLLRFTYKGQSLKGTDTIHSTDMNVDGDITIHVLRVADSSPPDENDIEIPQKPITDTNDTVMMEQTDCENQNEQLNVNDDVIAHQPEDILNRIEISPQSTSLPEKENIEVIVVEEQICGNKNPLKRKFDEKVVAGSSSKVCKVEPLKNFQANNLLISNSIADVKQKKVAADESLKKIPKLEAEVVNMDAMKVTYANDRNTLIERHRLAIEALKESNHNEINELNEAHRKALDEVITEKNSFVDTQSQTIDLMKQSMMAKFDKDLEKNGQKFKDEIENLKAEHRKEINDKEESHRKSLVELNKSNSEVLRKVMAEKFHVIESQNQNFELVKNRFAEEKQRLINERDNIKKTHDEKFNLLKSEMEDAIAAMNQSHNTEIQMLKDSSQNQLNETNQLKDNVINNLATKLDKERRFYCDQICRLKDDIENQKDSRQKEIVDLEALNALTAAKTDHKNNIDPANLETIEKQLIEKSKFHSENVQSIIKKCDVKRMKDISVLKSELKNQSEAHAIELNRLADEIELLKKNGGEIERMKSQHDAERTEWNRKFEKNSKENDKLHEYVVNQLKKNHEVIVQELYQKSNQKLLQCEETMKKLNEQKTAFETELKTSKENHIQTITKLQSEMKKTNEMNNKRTEELQMAQYRILEFEKKTTELQNERMQFVNELNRLRMNCGQPGEEQAMLAKNDRHTRIEQSHKYLTEQHSILYNENIKLKSSHQRLDQLLADKTKAFEEFQAFYKKTVDQLQAECDGTMSNSNAKTVEIQKLKDMRRVEDDVRNAAHQNEILNLIGQHRQDLESLRSEMERKMKDSIGAQRTAKPTASVLPNDINRSSSNEQNGDENSALLPIMVSSTEPKAEPKVRKCDNCGGKARFVTSYSYCSPLCNAAYCLKKTNRELDPQRQPQLS